MEQYEKIHNVDYLKRLAKKIKKEQNITHHQSLDLIAVNKGFNNWKHLVNKFKSNNNNVFGIVKTAPISLGVNKFPYKNLIILAVNKLIDENHISLNRADVNLESESGHAFIDLFGEASVVLWIKGVENELLISVWWKYNKSQHPQANLKVGKIENYKIPEPLGKKYNYKNFVGVIASCWLTRTNGKFLQDTNQKNISNIYTRKGELSKLKEMPIQNPKGYGASYPE